MDLLDRLLANDRWTTGRILQLSRGLSESEFNQPFDVGHQTLAATLEHIIFSLEVWAAAMAGEPMPETENCWHFTCASDDNAMRPSMTPDALSTVPDQGGSH